ncbi:hypothetical protein PCURB6_10620 [Paenibacillus curdlanolyticus]|nr:hypothetical protein PCURB6_10620 [Paenibacillus curdlanolyticus]
MFNDLELRKITTSERAKLNRKKVLPDLLDKHYNQKMSLSQMYKDFGYTPQMVRQALKENGYRVIDYQKNR